VAQTLAVDLGSSTAVLDPVEGLTEGTEDEDYLLLCEQTSQPWKT
jgi:zinc transport system substrate-binding protein